jgi:hypothetical protein
MAHLRSEWAQTLIEASGGQGALATVRSVWRAGRQTLFEVTCARNEVGWIGLPCIGSKLTLHIRVRPRHALYDPAVAP